MESKRDLLSAATTKYSSKLLLVGTLFMADALWNPNLIFFFPDTPPHTRAHARTHPHPLTTPMSPGFIQLDSPPLPTEAQPGWTDRPRAPAYPRALSSAWTASSSAVVDGRGGGRGRRARWKLHPLASRSRWCGRHDGLAVSSSAWIPLFCALFISCTTTTRVSSDQK